MSQRNLSQISFNALFFQTEGKFRILRLKGLKEEIKIDLKYKIKKKIPMYLALFSYALKNVMFTDQSMQ